MAGLCNKTRIWFLGTVLPCSFQVSCLVLLFFSSSPCEKVPAFIGRTLWKGKMEQRKQIPWAIRVLSNTSWWIVPNLFSSFPAVNSMPFSWMLFWRSQGVRSTVLSSRWVVSGCQLYTTLVFVSCSSCKDQMRYCTKSTWHGVSVQ